MSKLAYTYQFNQLDHTYASNFLLTPTQLSWLGVGREKLKCFDLTPTYHKKHCHLRQLRFFSALHFSARMFKKKPLLLSQLIAQE